MTAPRYTPYDGSSQPFTIGLSAVEPQNWLVVGDDLEDYLMEKTRLLTLDVDAVFRQVDGSEAAQKEAYDLIADHLLRQHSETYAKQDDDIAFLGRTLNPADAVAPLVAAGSLVADDLVILENRNGGWRVTAGYVSFPSTWSLAEKAGKTIGEIHGPVPDFATGSRNDDLINRMFDRIQPGRIVERFNWSIYPAGDLPWPPARNARETDKSFDPRSSFVRVERQTLLKLPETGAILFTILILRDPVQAILGNPVLRDGLASQLEAMTPAQLDYKGLAAKRARLLDLLRAP